MSPTARTVIDLNMKRYRELLETETDHTKRETITWLLAEEEAKLAWIEEWGGNSEERRQPDIRDWVDRRGMRPSVEDLKAAHRHRRGATGASL